MNEIAESLLALIDQERVDAGQLAERAKRDWNDTGRDEFRVAFTRWSAVEARMLELKRKADSIVYLGAR